MGFRRAIIAIPFLAACGCLPNSSGIVSTQTAAQIDMKCSTPDGISGRPSTIYEVMTLINALPKPTSLGCFLDALEKPLKVLATSSQLNGQPAEGARSPRIFIINAGLILSVVPAGVGSNRLEMSESAPYPQSIKGEVIFPVLTAVSTSVAYSTIRSGNGTSCASCHQSETPVSNDSTHFGAFASEKRYPDPFFAVSIQSLLQSERQCRPDQEAYRCRILSAVVGPDRDAYSGTY